jgi:hypothetical protein
MDVGEQRYVCPRQGKWGRLEKYVHIREERQRFYSIGERKNGIDGEL